MPIILRGGSLMWNGSDLLLMRRDVWTEERIGSTDCITSSAQWFCHIKNVESLFPALRLVRLVAVVVTVHENYENEAAVAIAQLILMYDIKTALSCLHHSDIRVPYQWTKNTKMCYKWHKINQRTLNNLPLRKLLSYFLISVCYNHNNNNKTNTLERSLLHFVYVKSSQINQPRKIQYRFQLTNLLGKFFFIIKIKSEILLIWKLNFKLSVKFLFHFWYREWNIGREREKAFRLKKFRQHNISDCSRYV